MPSAFALTLPPLVLPWLDRHHPYRAPVAQLDRVADFESEGWRFESSRAREANCCGGRRPRPAPAFVLHPAVRKRFRTGPRRRGTKLQACRPRRTPWRVRPRAPYTSRWRSAANLKGGAGHVLWLKTPHADNTGAEVDQHGRLRTDLVRMARERRAPLRRGRIKARRQKPAGAHSVSRRERSVRDSLARGRCTHVSWRAGRRLLAAGTGRIVARSSQASSAAAGLGIHGHADSVLDNDVAMGYEAAACRAATSGGGWAGVGANLDRHRTPLAASLVMCGSHGLALAGRRPAFSSRALPDLRLRPDRQPEWAVSGVRDANRARACAGVMRTWRWCENPFSHRRRRGGFPPA